MQRSTMLLPFLGLLFAVPFQALAGGEKTKPGEPLERGFNLIFNGKNFHGWREKKAAKELDAETEAFKGRFKIVDGSLLIDPKVKGDRYIETVAEFAKDVHVRFDFKPGPACNNDIFLRGSKFDIVLKNLKNVKEGEWSRLDIIVTGDKIEHKINGDVVRTGKTKNASSPLMIRAEFGAIEIKNIAVKQ